MTDSNERPEPEGVIMKYPAAVSDRWRFHQDPKYGSETENTERKIVFSAETIREEAESYCDYLDHISKDGLTKKEKQQRESVKEEIRKFAEVFSGDE